jgi:hypothetical protein
LTCLPLLHIPRGRSPRKAESVVDRLSARETGAILIDPTPGFPAHFLCPVPNALKRVFPRTVAFRPVLAKCAVLVSVRRFPSRRSDYLSFQTYPVPIVTTDSNSSHIYPASIQPLNAAGFRFPLLYMGKRANCSRKTTHVRTNTLNWVILDSHPCKRLRYIPHPPPTPSGGGPNSNAVDGFRHDA